MVRRRGWRYGWLEAAKKKGGWKEGEQRSIDGKEGAERYR